MATPDDDRVWALRALRDQVRQRQYRIARQYYAGRHELTFATEKFRNAFGGQLRAFADNLCPAVVDSISERLRVNAVSSDNADLAAKATKIWSRNRMDVRAPETHHESLLTGDGYALVWPNQAGQAVIWSVPADQMAVSYDPDQPGIIRKAARLWWDPEGDRRIHLDFYYPDRVERFASQAQSRSNALPSSYQAQTFLPYEVISEDGQLQVESVLPHKFGMPVVHFPNRRYHCYGVSELENVRPLQDALNKAVCDMLVAMEFSAYRQRYAAGLDVGEVGEDGKPINPPFGGADRIITSPDANTKFGTFDSSDLTQFVEVQENLRSEIARVSGTPLHYLFITRGDFPSGEAMKSAEARFTHKVENRQESFGNHWEDALALALRIEGEEAARAEMLQIEWESASPLVIEPGEYAPTRVNASA